MKKKSFLLLFFLLALSPCAFPFSAILDSNIVKEGEIIKVTIQNDKLLKAAEINFRNERYPVFFEKYDKKEGQYIYSGIAPVPLGTTGRKKMVIKYMLGSEEFQVEQKVSIKKTKIKTAQLDTGNQVTKLSASLRDDGEIISDFQQKVTAVRYKFPFVKPVEGRTSEEFGTPRVYDNGAAAWRHKGWDIAAKTGTPVKAANTGTVEAAATSKGYGKTIIINHGGGIYTLYFHLDKIFVRRGQQVSTGDIIGNVGSTGLATGPHLHWQINAFKVPVNPDKFLLPF